MKLLDLSIENVLMASRVSIDFRGAPVHLICGGNEAGKSSIADALDMVLTGELRRIALKKHAAVLVTGSAKKGAISLTRDHGRGPVTTSFALPQGKLSGEAPDVAAIVRPSTFARMSSAERRPFLVSLLEVRHRPEDIAAELLKRGCAKDAVDEVKALLVSGFDLAEKGIVDRAAQARADWKAVTGEVYGSSKADEWAPVVAAFEPAKLQAALAERDAARDRHTQAVTALGALQERVRRVEESGTRRKEREGLAAAVPALEQHVAESEAEVKTIDEGLAKARASAAKKGARLVCPCCNEAVMLVGDRLVKGDGDGQTPKTVEQLTAAVNAARVRLGKRRADLEVARGAKAALEASADVAPSPAEIEQAKETVTMAADYLRTAESMVEQEQDKQRASSDASDASKKAAAAHDRVTQWTKLAEALAGVRSSLVRRALDPVNERLEVSAARTGWKTVLIDDDFEVYVGGLPYAVQSKSSQWRADAMLAEALATVSGVKFLMLDEIDVLDLPGRSQCLMWLIDMAQSGEHDTIVAVATLKEKPALPAEVAVHWIEGGVYSNTRQAEEAAA